MTQLTDDIRQQMHAPVHKRRIAMSKLLFDLLVIQQGEYSLAHDTFALLTSTEFLDLPQDAAELVVTYANFAHTGYQQIARAFLPASFLISANRPLEAHRFLINSDQHCPFRAQTLRYLHQDLSQVQEIDSWDSIIHLIQAGQGIALLPDYLMARDDLMRTTPHQRFKIPYATFVRSASSLYESVTT